MNTQDKRGFFVLPQNPEESGYYAYGTPTGGQGQYAHPSMLNFLFWLELRWSANEQRKFGVGNISLAEGATSKPHRSHRNGLQVDIRPIRKDGAQSPVSYKSKDYDLAATKRLVALIISSGMVNKVMFNDPHIDGIKPMAGHDDHIHIEVRI
jgi:penicillin-insensitive murein endopeptidase